MLERETESRKSDVPEPHKGRLNRGRLREGGRHQGRSTDRPNVGPTGVNTSVDSADALHMRHVAFQNLVDPNKIINL